MIKRIHIFGGPGSGKTTLAKKMSEELNIPHYDLDNLRYKEDDVDYTSYEDEKRRSKRLKQIIKKEQWITEGSYTNFAMPCFEKAEKIIILETSIFKTTYRIIKRLLLHKLRIERLPKKQSWKKLPELLKWNYIFHYQRIPILKQKIKHLTHKTIKLKT